MHAGPARRLNKQQVSVTKCDTAQASGFRRQYTAVAFIAHGRTIEESLIFGQIVGRHAPEGLESRSSGLRVYEESDTVNIHRLDASNLLGPRPASGKRIETIYTCRVHRMMFPILGIVAAHLSTEPLC